MTERGPHGFFGRREPKAVEIKTDPFFNKQLRTIGEKYCKNVVGQILEPDSRIPTLIWFEEYRLDPAYMESVPLPWTDRYI